MKITDLLGEDRAVSPVIGVILMVAITVILAAVIGTFVLGLGDQVSESTPQAQFTFAFSENGGSAESFTVTHDGGDSIDADTLEVKVGGTTAWENSTGATTGFTNSTGWTKADITAGNGLKITDAGDGVTTPSQEIESGEEIRIIWNSLNSDKTATVGRAEAGF